MVEAGLVALAIVEDLDELEEVAAGVGSGFEPDPVAAADVGDLPLEGCPEGLHGGVVEAVPGGAERQLEAGVASGHDEVERRVLGWDPLSLWWMSPSGLGAVRPR